MDDAAAALEVERSEREALADLLAAAEGAEAAALVRSWRQGRDGLVLHAPTLPLTLFNRAFGLGLEAGPDDALLAELLSRVGAERSPRFGIQPAPGPLGEAWREHLRARGFEPRLQSLVQMARDLVEAPQQPVAAAAGLEVSEVGADDDVDRFAATARAGFGLPPWFGHWLQRLPGRRGWHCFVATRDGDTTAVAAAALFVPAGGDVGWLGIAGTLPEHRGLGAQRSLMLARLACATRFGCRLASTETGAPEVGKPHSSYSNMLGCGFRQVALRTSWPPPA